VKEKSEVIFCYTHRFSDVEKWFKEELAAIGLCYSYLTKEELHPEFRDEGNIIVMRIFR
jgi:hypothetical protein